MQKQLWIIIGVIVIALAAIGGSYYFFTKDKTEAPAQNQNNVADLFNSSAGNGDANTQPQTLPELPEVVAKVNGQDITKTQLQNAESQILASQGIDPSSLNLENQKQLRIQALDNLISNQLVTQAANTTDIAIEEDAINDQIDLIKGQFQDEAQFNQLLTQQGIDMAKFRELVQADLKIQKYLESSLGLLAIQPTEEEIAAFYNQEVEAAKKASSTQPIPPLEEVSENLKNILIQQQQQAKISAHLKELSDNANIEILI